ncbi:hypothetical protein PAMA_013360 [Pampus argenteus]
MDLGYQMFNNPCGIMLWAEVNIGRTRDGIPDIPRKSQNTAVVHTDMTIGWININSCRTHTVAEVLMKSFGEATDTSESVCACRESLDELDDDDAGEKNRREEEQLVQANTVQNEAMTADPSTGHLMFVLSIMGSQDTLLFLHTFFEQNIVHRCCQTEALLLRETLVYVFCVICNQIVKQQPSSPADIQSGHVITADALISWPGYTWTLCGFAMDNPPVLTYSTLTLELRDVVIPVAAAVIGSPVCAFSIPPAEAPKSV